MNFALSVIVKTTVLLACASLVTLGLRRASASARHAVWATVLLCALLLPLASVLLPELALPVLPVESFTPAPPVPLANGVQPTPGTGQVLRSGTSEAVTPRPVITVGEAADSRTFSISQNQALLLVWGLGAGIVLLRLLLGSLTIRRLARGSIAVEDSDWADILDDLRATFSLKRGVTLRISDRTIPPMTWGIFRPVVLLPATAAEWTLNRRRLVLAHELAHVRRNDGILQVLLQAVCSLYWFNPIVRYAARRLRIERECACDDQVLKLGADGDDYADHLLQVARTLNPAGGLSLATVAMAHRSQLETRLLAILDNRTRRQSITRLVSAFLFFGAFAMTLFAATLQLDAKTTMMCFA